MSVPKIGKPEITEDNWMQLLLAHAAKLDKQLERDDLKKIPNLAESYEAAKGQLEVLKK